ncbi:regulator of g protein signaling [Anaeramoeba flamelloides]|uniref:Regulator of g protein signaling n=1 Tax=Anaeramoeba flamelloides TaxID=1746091 RepID=A0ABQ8YRL8_9EUKA|nr:regulator of g protein signaling [Anaeramoeba flamelloides]
MGNFQTQKQIKKRKAKSYIKQLDNSDKPVCIIDSEYHFIYANMKCFKYLGFAGEGITNRSLSNLSPLIQPAQNLENKIYAKQEVTLASQYFKFASSEKRSCNWVFENKNYLYNTTIKLFLIKIYSKPAVQVEIFEESNFPISQSSSKIVKFPKHNSTNDLKIQSNQSKTSLSGSFSKSQIIQPTQNSQSLQEQIQKIEYTIKICLEKNKNLKGLVKTLRNKYKNLKQSFNKTESFSVSLKMDPINVSSLKTINKIIEDMPKYAIYYNELDLTDMEYSDYVIFENQKPLLEKVAKYKKDLLNQLMYLGQLFTMQTEIYQQEELKALRLMKLFEMKDISSKIEKEIKNDVSESKGTHVAIINKKHSKKSNEKKKHNEKKKKNIDINTILSKNNITINYNFVPFNKLLTNPKYSEYFIEFLKSVQKEENYYFIQDIKKFQTLTDKSNIKKESIKVFKKYILDGSDDQINISSGVKNNIIEYFESKDYNTGIYKQAYEEVYNLLLNDSYLSFIESLYYEKLQKSVPNFNW